MYALEGVEEAERGRTEEKGVWNIWKISFEYLLNLTDERSSVITGRLGERIKLFYKVIRSKTRTTPHIFLNFMFISFSPRIYSLLFFAYQVSPTIDAWHIFKSSYDETINKLLVSSYELLNICQASIIDFTLLCKKHISKVFTFQHFSL